MEDQLKEEYDRFADFLRRKNIHPETFAAGDPETFQKWQKLFALLHEDSFVLQQKFSINPIRRRFPQTIFPARA
jgi:hypothetical protein